VTKFVPSDVICVDESMSRWYGHGGSCINLGLPHYMAIDRKPDAACEIWTACCGKSDVMMQLWLVKTSQELAMVEQDHGITNNNIVDDVQLQHGTKV
jgi:hypothetical protein